MRKTSHLFPVAILLCVCGAAAVLLASPSAYSQALDDLDDADPTTRSAAIQYLASLGASRLDDLLDELADDYSPLATAGLGEVVRTIGIGTGDVDDVALLLSETDPPTRHAAVTVLGLQAASARTQLEAVAADADELSTVRAAAAAALRSAGAQARSGLRDIIRDKDAPAPVRKAALGSLAQVSAAGAGDVKAVAANANRPWRIRRAAIHALGDPAVPTSTPLSQLLASTEIRVRAAVVEALFDRGTAADLVLLAGRLTDQAAPVRLAALRGVMLASAAVTYRTAVIGRMLDADPRIQALAAELVGQTCSNIASTVRPTLVSLLASTSFHVRLKAALALFAHGDKTGGLTMKADALSPNPSIAAQAAQAYRLITGP